MKNKRRDFLKMTGIAGLSLAGGGIMKSYASESMNHDYEKKRIQHFNMSGYSAPKIDTVRIGVIGLGQRGPAHVRTMSRVDGVEIRALCDLRPHRYHLFLPGSLWWFHRE